MDRDAAWVSDALRSALGILTGQQAQGVLRIVQHELNGGKLSDLLDCPDQICSSATFYGGGSRRGWRDRPGFQAALALARSDYRAWLLEHGTADALALLAQAAPGAARVLDQQVNGDPRAQQALIEMLGSGSAQARMTAAQQLGAAGLVSSVPALWKAWQDEGDAPTRIAIAEAIGAILGHRDPGRRDAAAQVLDRAAVETAPKSTVERTGEGDQFLALVATMSDEALAQALANLEVGQTRGLEPESEGGSAAAGAEQET